LIYPNLVFSEIHNWDVKKNFKWQEDSKLGLPYLMRHNSWQICV